MRRYRISKPIHGSQEWLTARWKDENGNARITASVAGVIHGAHPFMSAADLASQLLSSTPPEPTKPNAAMERGNRLEPTLIKWVADNQKLNLVTPDEMYCYEEDGVRLLATIDAMSLAEQGYERVFEVKTTNKQWQSVLPDYWYWQGVHQAICTGVHSIDWAIFDSNLELHHYVQKVSSDEKQIHIEACRRFLAQIDMGMLPEGVQYEYRHVASQHPAGNRNLTVELPVETIAQLRELEAIKKTRKEIDEQEDKIKAEICGLLGDAEFGTVDGRLVFTWKTAFRNSLDQKRLEEEHPALVEKFQKQTTFRTFRTVTKGEK